MERTPTEIDILVKEEDHFCLNKKLGLLDYGKNNNHDYFGQY